MAKKKAKDEKKKAKDEKKRAKGEKKKAKGEKANGKKAKDEKKKAKDGKAKDGKAKDGKAKDGKAKGGKKKAKDGKAKGEKNPEEGQEARGTKPKGTKPKGTKPSGKQKATSYPRIPLTLLAEEKVGVESASAIAPIGRGRALVVDDDVGIFLFAPGTKPKLLRGAEDASGLGDLESLCTSDDGKTVYAVSEENGEVFALTVGRGADPLSKPKRLGALARPGKVENKGWEGASYLGPLGDQGPCLLVAHEREPMAVGVFTLPALREVAIISLDGTEIESLIDDVADVAVCPSTDHVFLLSDQAHRIVETRLDLEARRPEALAVFNPVLEKGNKPRGLAFETPDRLVVVTDHSSLLLRFALARS